MTISVVGSGPAVEAVEAALADVEATVEQRDVESLTDATLGIVVGVAGATTFEQANEIARDAGTPWLAVELGGIGGYPVVDAAVAGFTAETACYDCLQTRVGSNVDPEQEPTAAPAAPVARFAGAVAGKEATAFVEGEPTLFGRVREIPHAQRQLLPAPFCHCGGQPDSAVPRSVVEREVEESLTRAEQGLDDRVGLVAEVGEIESFPAPYYLARTCRTETFSDVQAGQQAAGVSVDWNTAFMKALGEGLERYCAGVYRSANFQSGRAGTLENAIAPSEFVQPEWGESETTQWMRGENLQTTEEVWLPAELVMYPPPQQSIRPAITTGLGLGNGGVDALLSGLYEVVERDATVLSWYSTFEPLGLTVEDEGFQTLANRARSESLTVTPLLLTQDVDIPVVGVAVHRDEEWPQFAMGSAAELDPAAAARSALAEALQNWMELSGMGKQQATQESGAIGKYASLTRQAREFIDVDGTIPASQVGPGTVPEGEAELAAVLERYDDAGLETYAARLTTRDVEALGFEAVRVLSPSAQPLFFDEPYFGERAETVPETLGFESRRKRAHHPFP